MYLWSVTKDSHICTDIVHRFITKIIPMYKRELKRRITIDFNGN